MSELLRFAGEVEIQAAADSAKRPTFRLVAYDGQPMRVSGFGNVIVDLAGADVAGVIPLLESHGEALDNIAGQGVAKIESNQIVVAGELTDATPSGRKVLALARSGITLQASIGYSPDKREYVRAGDTVRVNGAAFTAPADGLSVVRKGRLREVSLVPVGANANTQVTIAAQAVQKGTRRMADETTNTVEVPDELKAAWDKPGLTDSERVLARWNAARFNEPNIRQQTEKFLHAALAGALDFPAFEREILKAQVRDLELKAIRAERPVGPQIRSSSRDVPGGDSAILEASLLCHLGSEDVSARVFGDQVTQIARDARMTSLIEILQAAFRANGQEPPRNRNDLIKASFSSVAISNIVSGAQNKILLDQWQRLPLLSMQLCRRISAGDFKQGKAIRLVGRRTMMKEIPPAGEFELGYLQDSAATYQLATYGRMYSVTRQDTINDDLGALDELPRVIARGAGLKMESVFWALVLGNAGDFFSESNGNLTDVPLDLAGLGTAVALMRNLTDADGEPILVEPRTLVVPPALESAADALFASTNVVVAGTGDAVTSAPSASPFAGKYRPLTSPYISNTKYSGNSAAQWYLFSDPTGGPAAFVVAFLNGMSSPIIERQDSDFSTLGIEFRGFLDFGFAQCDSQGAVKSTGDGA